MSMSPDGQLFLSSWSDIKTPTRQRLYAADGTLVRTIDSNPSHELKRLQVRPARAVADPGPRRFPARGRADLAPRPRFDQEVSGLVQDLRRPAHPDGLGRWDGGRHVGSRAGPRRIRRLPHGPPQRQRQGGASRRGRRTSTWAFRSSKTSRTRSTGSSRSPMSTARGSAWPGHSYGGYITSYAMTHSDLFAAGIAGAPVTDWRDYDSIYTERYMGLPQDNPEGYNVSSVVRAAGKLHGKLLILHGAIDDNVSLRNTMRLVEALEDANKDFELMIYPSSRHGIRGPHYTRLQLDFIRRTLGGTQPRNRPRRATWPTGPEMTLQPGARDWQLPKARPAAGTSVHAASGSN